MKQLTCKDVRGACDAIITGNTAKEMAENCKNHVLELQANGDTSHDAAMERMRTLSPIEQMAFWAEFQQAFADAPEM